MENQKNIKDRLQFIAQHLEERKGNNIVTLDVQGISNVFDYMVIVDGFVNRHVSSMIRSLVDEMKIKFNERPVRVDGLSSGEWVLIDFGDILVHAFIPELREMYDLETLWSKSKASI